MKIYYSPSQDAFYDIDFASYTLPSDAQLITDAQRDALIQASMDTVTKVNDTPSE